MTSGIGKEPSDAGAHGRLSPDYMREVLTLADAGRSEAAVVEAHGRLRSGYAEVVAKLPMDPAAALQEGVPPAYGIR
jgi:hypothetical protein